MDDSRYIIGIDLGTTNIAVCYIDTGEDDEAIVNFPITQLTAAGEADTVPLLPSFCYLPGPSELPKGALSLPWDKKGSIAVGQFARDQGAQVPDRLIASAKSWLTHAGVDRTKAILPWGSNLVETPMSPVDVTAAFLTHIKEAWDHQFKRHKPANRKGHLLENQQVVITIPASFDETARELTINAAAAAGYGEIHLLEEPLAAFYAWLQGRESDWYKAIDYDQNCLIVDVGGGTTDFSIVRIDDEGYLHRCAVGSHLLLGGDNIDMALARQMEEGWGTRLGAVDWTMLCRRCCEAKEFLLESRKAKTDITLLSAGSSVLKNLKKAELRRDDLVALMEDGFYPKIPVDEPPIARRQAGIRTMGLPYAVDAGITRYLLEFLHQSAKVVNDPEDDHPCMFPDRVLFNGGSMKTGFIRRRILDAIEGWRPDRGRPKELIGEDVSQAVAVGAAYYGRVRRGHGVKVRSGMAHACYLEVADDDGGKRLLAVMPRDTDENVVVKVPGDFRVHTNQKVLFNLFTSATRLDDEAGALVTDPTEEDELHLVAPLVSVLPLDDKDKESVAVHIEAQLNVVGGLELSLDASDSEHHWPLKFDLRAAAEPAPPSLEPALEAAGVGREERREIVIDPERVELAAAVLREVFSSASDNLKTLTRHLEDALKTPKADWPLHVLRSLADVFLELRDSRNRTPSHESRWLNLAGYCMRPGFGDAADEMRLQEIWKLWIVGPIHERDWDVVAEWHVFWRRIVSGLGVGHQITIGQQLAKELFPNDEYAYRIRFGERARQEMWRCLAALELQPVNMKIAAGNVMMERPEDVRGFECWVLARIGARRPFHAPVNAVVPAETAAAWLSRLMVSEEERPDRMHLFAIARIGALTGDRNLDLSEEILQPARDYMAEQRCPRSWVEGLHTVLEVTREDQGKVLGDALPLGLIIVD